MIFNVVTFAVAIASLSVCSGFGATSSSRIMSRSSTAGSLTMEYIPEGFSKSQWEALKKKEAEELKSKNMGGMGTTKFKSRSFEAWQKAGGKHLFPVDPNTASYEERPYMQRKDGDWEGSDLKKRGLVGKGQGEGQKRLAVDGIYEKAKAEGKLDSPSLFGIGKGLDWTGTKKVEFNPDGNLGTPRAVSTKVLSPEETERLKKNLAKVKITPKAGAATPVAAEPKKEAPKKMFGIF